MEVWDPENSIFELCIEIPCVATPSAVTRVFVFSGILICMCSEFCLGVGECCQGKEKRH